MYITHTRHLCMLEAHYLSDCAYNTPRTCWVTMIAKYADNFLLSYFPTFRYLQVYPLTAIRTASNPPHLHSHRNQNQMCHSSDCWFHRRPRSQTQFPGLQTQHPHPRSNQHQQYLNLARSPPARPSAKFGRSDRFLNSQYLGHQCNRGRHED